MKKKMVVICILCLAAVFAFAACSTPNVDGKYTDPLTGNTLDMSKGNFTLTDSGGAVISEGTYQAAEDKSTYNVTYADGSTGTATVKDTTIEFTNSDTGEVVVYETSEVE